MPSPSDNLVHQLIESQLCSRQDIDACEPIVRRLCHDLPDFDSVWLDALVQRRILTPWQASTLQSAHPERLHQGGYRLLEPLGQETFLGRSVTGDRLVALREVAEDYTPRPGSHQALELTDERTGEAPDSQQWRLTWLEDIVETLDRNRRGAPASLELPTQVFPHEGAENKLWLISSYVHGWRLDELLVRGGRMPWPAVVEIGRDLLAAVQWLEGLKLVHGDISLRNIRLRPNGQAVLVDPFVARVLRPSISFRTDLLLRNVEFTAPELAGTARPPDSRSELYSVGCVLWQMLTSRSAFLSTDALTRLLKSQERDVDDVRTLVPDCPDQVARCIQSLTRRSPELRPATAAEALRNWSACSGKGHSRTRRLLQRLPDRRQQLRSPASRRRLAMRRRLATTAAAALMVVLAVFVGIERGVIPKTLRLGPHVAETKHPDHVAAENVASQTVATAPRVENVTQSEPPLVNGMRPLPIANAAGIIRLQAGIPYRATTLTGRGSLRIECSDAKPAVVEVDTAASWHLQADQVSLRNIEVRRRMDAVAPGTALPDALLDVTAAEVVVAGCLLRNGNRHKTATCVVWQPSTTNSATAATSLELADCVLTGSGWGLFLKTPADRCQLNNVLVNTGRAAIRCDVDDAEGAALSYELTRVSQVSGDSFLDVLLSGDEAAPGVLVRCSSGESVLAVGIGLVRFVSSAQVWSAENLQVEFPLRDRGNPTIVPVSVSPAVYFDRSLASVVQLNAAQTEIESLLFADPVFRGQSTSAGATSPFAEYELLDYEGPKLSSVNLPGADIRAFLNFEL